MSYLWSSVVIYFSNFFYLSDRQSRRVPNVGQDIINIVCHLLLIPVYVLSFVLIYTVRGCCFIWDQHLYNELVWLLYSDFFQQKILFNEKTNLNFVIELPISLLLTTLLSCQKLLPVKYRPVEVTSRRQTDRPQQLTSSKPEI